MGDFHPQAVEHARHAYFLTPLRGCYQLPSDRQDAVAAALLAEMEQEAWDRQIEADYKAGKFDKLIKRLREDIAAGHAEPL
jgi:hypothetical protein